MTPILVAPNLEIIDHELLWLALKENGETRVDIIVVSNKSAAELKALRLVLNRTALDARWDDQNLRSVLEELVEADFDLEVTGFDPPEIDYYLAVDVPQANVEESGSDIPAVDSTAISAQGAIWVLGNHRVGCGSATDRAFVGRVLAGRKASVCFVDPPLQCQGRRIPYLGKGRHQHREFVLGAGELSAEAYFALLRNSLFVLKICCAPTALVYACIDWRHVMEMTVAGRACDMPLYSICVWTKTNGDMGGIYRNQHEMICVFKAGSEAPLDNVELGRYGRNRSNVWSYAGMSSFGKERDELLAVKPVKMIADVLRDVTKRNDVVLDTFLGSGSG